MNNITFTLIETVESLDKYGAQLSAFFDSLDIEKKFAPVLNMEHIKKSDFTMIALDGDRIVGVAGVNTYHRIIHKAYVGVKKEYQNGLGAFLSLKRNKEASKRYDLIILKISPENVASQKMNRVLGYKDLGRRFSIDYLAMPFNYRGLCLCHAYKMIMPAINVFDKVFKKQ